MKFQDLYNKAVISNIVGWDVGVNPTPDGYKAEELTKLDFLSSLKTFIEANPEHVVSTYKKDGLFSDELEQKAIQAQQKLYVKYKELKKTKQSPDDEYFSLFDEMVNIVKLKMKEKNWQPKEIFFFNDKNLGSPDQIIGLVSEMAEVSKEFLANKPTNISNRRLTFTMKGLTDYMDSFEDISYHIGYNNGSFMTALDKDNSRIHIARNKKNIQDTAASITHEVGHALYQNRLLNKYTTVGQLGDSISLSLHESSSIFNEISLSGIDFDISNDKKNLFRLGSDKIHYIIHIYIRMKIEEMLFTDQITAKDISDVWNKMMTEYTGLTPKNDWEGFLQDVHWNQGAFGYFHSYAIGFFNAVLMYNKIRKDLSGDLVEDTLKLVLPTIDKWYGRLNENSENIISIMHPNLKTSISNYKLFINHHFNYKNVE
jgi:hypothetical protein